MNKDWTDELRASVQKAAVNPSEGSWERLAAGLPSHKTPWLPYALATACCLAACGLFIFRESSTVPGKAASEKRAEAVSQIKEPVSQIKEPVSQIEEPVSQIEEPVSQEDTYIQKTVGQLSSAPPKTVRTKERPAPETEPGRTAERTLPKEDGTILKTESDEKTAVPAVLSEPGEKTPVAPDYERKSAAKKLPATGYGTNGQSGGKATPAKDFGHFTSDKGISKKPARKVAFSFSLGSSPYANPSADAKKLKNVDSGNITEHEMPMKLDAAVLFPVSSRFSIKTGLEYSDLRSRVGNGSQRLQWLGVPLGVNCNLAEWDAVRLDAGAAAKAEHLLQASLLGTPRSEKMQWSLGLDASLHVKIYGPLYFSLSPQLSWYFTETTLETYRSSHPISFTLHAGLTIQL